MRVARILLLAVGALVLLTVVLLKPYRIPSGSMVPTFVPGDRVLSAPFWYRLASPARGDLVVFHPNGRDEHVFRSGQASTRTFVKRVVALPGETAGSIAGRLYVCRSGIRPTEPSLPEHTRGCAFLAESYTHGQATTRCDGDQPFGPETVPAGAYLLLGDNRTDSEDSRCFGPIPRGQIIGRVVTRYWPFGRIGRP